jgi:hypothetical protein
MKPSPWQAYHHGKALKTDRDALTTLTNWCGSIYVQSYREQSLFIAVKRPIFRTSEVWFWARRNGILIKGLCFSSVIPSKSCGTKDNMTVWSQINRLQTSWHSKVIIYATEEASSNKSSKINIYHGKEDRENYSYGPGHLTAPRTGTTPK